MKYLITRADDFGAGDGANRAILNAVRFGTVKNVSCMAVGPKIERDAKDLISSGVCTGMHFTINSEWDRVKWKPCSDATKIKSLLNDSGDFYQNEEAFINFSVDPDELKTEFNAQLDRLTRLGLKITYVDQHMMPNKYIKGMSDLMAQWIKEKGLVDHKDFYYLPDLNLDNLSHTLSIKRISESFTEALTDGISFIVLHPHCLGLSSFLMGNKDNGPFKLAIAREIDYRLYTSKSLKALLTANEIELLTYPMASELFSRGVKGAGNYWDVFR